MSVFDRRVILLASTLERRLSRPVFGNVLLPGVPAGRAGPPRDRICIRKVSVHLYSAL